MPRVAAWHRACTWLTRAQGWALFIWRTKKTLTNKRPAPMMTPNKKTIASADMVWNICMCGRGRVVSEWQMVRTKKKKKDFDDGVWCSLSLAFKGGHTNRDTLLTVQLPSGKSKWNHVTRIFFETGLSSTGSAGLLHFLSFIFSKWYQFGGGRNLACIHGCQDAHPFHPSIHLDANCPWCTLSYRPLNSQPVCTTTERSAATSAPVTVVLVSLDLHDLGSKFRIHSSSGIRKSGRKTTLVGHWGVQQQTLHGTNSTLFYAAGHLNNLDKATCGACEGGENNCLAIDITFNWRSLYLNSTRCSTNGNGIKQWPTNCSHHRYWGRKILQSDLANLESLSWFSARMNERREPIGYVSSRSVGFMVNDFNKSQSTTNQLCFVGIGAMDHKGICFCSTTRKR